MSILIWRLNNYNELEIKTNQNPNIKLWKLKHIGMHPFCELCLLRLAVPK